MCRAHPRKLFLIPGSSPGIRVIIKMRPQHISHLLSNPGLSCRRQMEGVGAEIKTADRHTSLTAGTEAKSWKRGNPKCWKPNGSKPSSLCLATCLSCQLQHGSRLFLCKDMKSPFLSPALFACRVPIGWESSPLIYLHPASSTWKHKPQPEHIRVT